MLRFRTPLIERSVQISPFRTSGLRFQHGRAALGQLVQLYLYRR
jgi:hypothetical protein